MHIHTNAGLPVQLVTEPEFEDPEAERYYENTRLTELQVSLPPTFTIRRDQAEQFLLSLSYCERPLSFEVVGLPDAITVQLVCRAEDRTQLTQQLGAHFPDAVLTEEEAFLAQRWDIAGSKETVVVDFGLAHEFMRPLATVRGFEVDPLISATGALTELGDGEVGVLQVLFQPARYPWMESVMRAVTDWEGGPFFMDAPDMVSLARAKVDRPLYATAIRVAAQSPAPGRAWEITRALGGALRQLSRPPSNDLIPLSDDGYDQEDHQLDLLIRQTHRSGMLLNSEELVSLVHLPSASVRTPKLARETTTTRAAPESATGPGLVLGENLHRGRTVTVTLSPEQRVRHTHLIGATGTGKSHLLLSLIIQNLEEGAGIGVLDPHGDLVDHVLGYVPEERMEDVILLDPADPEYAVGFNVLQAHSSLEKDLLASDMTAVFRRLSTSWGDQMTAVLANAVLAFLESEEGGTLADLRHFLVDADFRRRFIRTVQDEEIVFFWEKEFPLLSGRPQAPILTRLNTFLRHRLVRHMVAQKENRLDFGRMMNEGKIFLAKLAQGQVGEENAHLLGTLLVSKFHQLALSRQAVAEAKRRPFYLYVDEFHNFVTPSMAAILSGARKYGLGLTLAHQDLEQLRRRDTELLSAVLTNPAVRVCFRVGDLDAKKLAEGFSDFGPQDLQTLGVGEAICRIERADHNFNLRTLPLPAADPDTAQRGRERIIAHAHNRYATPREDVEALLRRINRPPPTETAPPERSTVPPEPQESPSEALDLSAGPKADTPTQAPAPRVEVARKAPLQPRPPSPPRLGKGGPQHTYLQELIKRWAGSRGWHVTVEKPILDGLGRVDVALSMGEDTVACEVSVKSTPDQELGNVQKCLAAGFDAVAVVAPERKVLGRVREAVEAAIEKESLSRVKFLTPEELFAFLETLEARSASSEETIRGWKVKTRYQTVEDGEKTTRTQAIAKVILGATKRLKGK